MGIDIRKSTVGEGNNTKLLGLDQNDNLVHIEKGTYALASLLVNYVLAVEGKSLIADTEITRLAGLKNYDDAAIKKLIIDETTRATEKEGDLLTAINKVKNDFDTFLNGATDSNGLIDKWTEIKAFLDGVTDTNTLTGLLTDYKAQVTGGSSETLKTLSEKFNDYVLSSALPDFSEFVKKSGNKQLSDENFSLEDKTKLNSIESGAQKNVAPDWNATAEQPGFIKNKPSIPSEYDDTALANRVAALEGVETVLDSINNDQV